ncbi:sugar transporter [Parapedobacter pyrenivorans]|uniref:Sugar transporter n=1 Tax=Parapedobacter pyrenivorans TaxID=1305674 RepID=A0A917HJ35_9SPHI|nr:sugar MFS transporter [Parapedobacter pyrenivorans]GGG81216.1 sugar transporter [Parapedobacter pyrenivorans]
MAFVPVNSPMANETNGRSYTPALIVLAVLYFMMGFITCLNDTLVPFFKTGFTLNYAESALVQFYFFLTYAVMSIPAGKIVEKVGYKQGMVFGFAIAGIGALLFFPAALLHQYQLFLGALFVLAIGIVLLQVAANPYITLLGKPDTASSRLTLIQGVGSIGTTVAPLFGAHFILSRLSESNASSDAVSMPYLAIGGMLFLIALVVYFLALPKVAKDEMELRQPNGRARQGIHTFRNLNFGLVGIFMYVGAEVAIGTFLTNYVADRLDIGEHSANNYVAFYWGGMLVGRLIGSVLLKLFKPQHVLVFAAGSAVALILFSVFSSGYLAVWTMISVGLCNSVMFAIIFSLSVQGLGRYTTQASGLLSTAIVGGAVIPYLQGVLIDVSGWELAFILPMLCYAYVCYYGLYGYRVRSPGS